MEEAFLDTNVLVRHFVYDPVLSHSATKCLEAIAGGKLRVWTTMLVVFETVFTLERSYDVPREDIRRHLLTTLQLPNLRLAGKSYLPEVFELYINKGISFADAFHAVEMVRRGTTNVISFDKDFDRVGGLQRLDPRGLLRDKAA